MLLKDASFVHFLFRSSVHSFIMHTSFHLFDHLFDVSLFDLLMTLLCIFTFFLTNIYLKCYASLWFMSRVSWIISTTEPNCHTLLHGETFTEIRVCVCVSNSVPKRSKPFVAWFSSRGTQEAHRAVSNEALYGVFRISGLITVTYLHWWNCWQAVTIRCFPALGQRTLPYHPFCCIRLVSGFSIFHFSSV